MCMRMRVRMRVRACACARRARADTPALPASPMNDVIVIGLGLALYAFMVVKGHLWLIGVAPFG